MNRPTLPDHLTIRFYFIYCSILTSYILYNAFIESEFTLMINSVPNNLSYTRTEKKESSPIVVCGKDVNSPIHLRNILPNKETEWSKEKENLVVIGHDEMNHVQTNNRLNAILHAMDYAHDINATLALTRHGWATKTLKLLFHHDHQNDFHWEQDMEVNLNIRFVEHDNFHHNDTLNKEGTFSEIHYNTSDEMYYYHTDASVETIKQRRHSILQYLWTHPTTITHGSGSYSKDMCVAVKNVESIGLKNNTQFSVVHSRWMKNNGCLNRMGALAHRMKKLTGISMDRKASCLLEPNYIKSIVKKCGLLGKPIYVITDGLKKDIIETLQADPIIGKDVYNVPETMSWVGGDMMLGALSDCFIGTPISTLSGNVARARIALGKDPSTNYLFAKKKKRGEDTWEFECQSDTDCLYDVRVMSHYVG